MVSANAYPDHAHYRDALRYASRFVLDPVLKVGIPRSRSRKAVADGGDPLSFPGGFATVYIIDNRGKTYALRVWRVEIRDAARRYQITRDFLQKQRLPFFVEHFEFIPNGIFVPALGRTYPILRMEWIDGYSLRDFIRQNLAQPTLIRAAADEFCKMVNELHKAHVGHGDLQGENMKLRVINGTVHYKLIDYDTLIVPALLGKPISSTGLDSYQHPARPASRTATEKDDFFSELVIYLSLRAIAEDSNLWSRFPARGRDKELLFEAADYTSPMPTPLFRRLYEMDGIIQKLAVILWNFSRCGSIAHLVPLERALELATEVKATELVAQPPRSDFERYLKSKLVEDRPPIGLPSSWLDDRAFRSRRTQTGRAQVSSTGSTAKDLSGSQPSFADILSGIRLESQRSQPLPTSPKKTAAPLAIALVVAGILLLMVIVGNISNNANNKEAPRPSVSATPGQSLSKEYSPRQSSAAQKGGTALDVPSPKANNSPARAADSGWDGLIRELRERADKESAPSVSEPTSTPFVEQQYVPPEPSSPPLPITCHVVNVGRGDYLNVRQGPGSDYTIIVMLPPQTGGVQLGAGRFRNGETIWQEIFIAGYHGYVNEIFLEADR